MKTPPKTSGRATEAHDATNTQQQGGCAATIGSETLARSTTEKLLAVRVTNMATMKVETVAEIITDRDRLRAAIVKHRDCIHGADYDYDGDETYQPEAELYRVLKSPK